MGAWLQTVLGPVGASSLFAYLQSAAMGGYGTAVVNGVVQAWGVVSVAMAGWWNNPSSNGAT